MNVFKSNGNLVFKPGIATEGARGAVAPPSGKVWNFIRQVLAKSSFTILCN